MSSSAYQGSFHPPWTWSRLSQVGLERLGVMANNVTRSTMPSKTHGWDKNFIIICYLFVDIFHSKSSLMHCAKLLHQTDEQWRMQRSDTHKNWRSWWAVGRGDNMSLFHRARWHRHIDNDNQRWYYDPLSHRRSMGIFCCAWESRCLDRGRYNPREVSRE